MTSPRDCMLDNFGRPSDPSTEVVIKENYIPTTQQIRMSNPDQMLDGPSLMKQS